MEVTSLLEQWSTGVHGFTTIHLDDVRKLPDRILNMMNNVNDAQRMENRIYRYVNAAVLIRKIESSDGKVRRYIDQLCFFSREEGKNRIYMYRGVADFLESEKSAEKSGYVWVSFFVENPCSDDFSGTRRGDWHRCRVPA